MDWDPNGIQRRVAGSHDFRLDGMRDLLWRAEGASVLDIGCNRGAVGIDFAHHGAAVVHGCDNYQKGIETAREFFSDLRSVGSRFEVVDLEQGSRALKPFNQDYDIVIALAVFHKIRRKMRDEQFCGLVQTLGKKTRHYFAWRATSGVMPEEAEYNDEEMQVIDRELSAAGLKLIHHSQISRELGLAAIWRRS